jgi:hypothetical protein
MKKKSNHEGDIKNGNWGTKGTNTTFDHAMGNRGKQLDLNQKPSPAKLPVKTITG